MDLDSDSDLIYITDNDNHRVQVFDKNGNFVSKWGSKSTLERPTAIAYDPLHESVYVNDKANNNIQVFSLVSTGVTDIAKSEDRSSDDGGEDSNDSDNSGNDDDKSKDEDNDGRDCDNSYPPTEKWNGVTGRA
jgi:DNA-binding beta-propeller fold protein YncE